MPCSSNVHRMAAYTAWANDVMLRNAARLPDAELESPRNTLFQTIAGTFDHILVVAEIFCAHLKGRDHCYTSRQRGEPLAFAEVAGRLRTMDNHFVSLTAGWSVSDLGCVIDFAYVDGSKGSMTRGDIVLHLANHATYHRGFISNLLYPILPNGAANDLTVFLRDRWPAIVRQSAEFAA